jgi:Transmembrane protein 43
MESIGLNRSNGPKLYCLVVLFTVGMVPFIFITHLLNRNELRNIQRISELRKSRNSVKQIDPYNNNLTTTATTNNNSNANVDHNNSATDTSSSSLDGQIIYVVGKLNITDRLIDTLFGVVAARNEKNTTNVQNNITSTLVTFSFLKIQRSAQMYQWREVKTTDDDGTHYRYDKQWLSYCSDSSRFAKRSSSRNNPNFPPFQSHTFIPDPIYFGNIIEITDNATLAALNWYEPLNTISIDDVPNGTDMQVSQVTKYIPNGFLYSPSSSSFNHSDQPSIGDGRVTCDVTRPSTISLVAQFHPAVTTQNGNSTSRYSLGPYTTRHGGTILIVQRGLWTVEEFFSNGSSHPEY